MSLPLRPPGTGHQARLRIGVKLLIAAPLTLVDLDQVAAGVVKDSDGLSELFRRFSVKGNTQGFQAFVLTADVVDGKCRPRDPGPEEGFLEGLRRWKGIRLQRHGRPVRLQG